MNNASRAIRKRVTTARKNYNKTMEETFHLLYNLHTIDKAYNNRAHVTNALTRARNNAFRHYHIPSMEGYTTNLYGNYANNALNQAMFAHRRQVVNQMKRRRDTALKRRVMNHLTHETLRPHSASPGRPPLKRKTNLVPFVTVFNKLKRRYGN